jgi:hypothetical protein
MAFGEDFRQRLLAICEGIVVGHRAVGIDPHDACGMIHEILATLHVAAVADREVELAISAEGDARTEMPAGCADLLHPEDRLHVAQRAFVLR